MRCSWSGKDPQMVAYHDEEWGVPEYDSRALWEKLMLDGFQAGLSWSIILRKRDAFRKAFKNFDPEKVARFDEHDVARLLQDSGIVRSRAKIEAIIAGARAYLKMKDGGEDFSTFVWNLAGGKPIQNRGPVPASTPLSEEMSKALKKRGFKFVGPVIVYAWMQAVGIVERPRSRLLPASTRVIKNDLRLALKARRMETILCELPQKRLGATLRHEAFSFARFRAFSEVAEPSSINAASGFEQMHIHLVICYASIGRVLHA